MTMKERAEADERWNAAERERNRVGEGPTTKQTQHTPGPWLREGLTVYALHHYKNEYRKGLPVMVNRFYAHVDDCLNQGGTEAEAEANARLIATAPKLLAVAEAALKWIDDHPDEGAYQIARALDEAITEAKGGA